MQNHAVFVAFPKFVAASLAMIAMTSAAPAAPFTVDTSQSKIDFNSMNIYLSSAPLALGTDFFFGAGVGAATAAYTHTKVSSTGVDLFFLDYKCGYWPVLASTIAQINCDVVFTPTVPNLSYGLDGFLDIGVEGAPSFLTANSRIQLAQDIGLGVIHYGNEHTYHGPCSLWQTENQQLGTRFGDLVMGVPLRLSLRFTLYMTHNEDTTASFGMIPGGTPFFRLNLLQRPCDGDLSGDGFVDDADFSSFAAAYDIFDCADPGMPPGCPADLNHDGFVDDADFVVFAASYDRILCP